MTRTKNRQFLSKRNSSRDGLRAFSRTVKKYRSRCLYRVQPRCLYRVQPRCLYRVQRDILTENYFWLPATGFWPLIIRVELVETRTVKFLLFEEWNDENYCRQFLSKRNSSPFRSNSNGFLLFEVYSPRTNSGYRLLASGHWLSKIVLTSFEQ